MVQVDVFWAYGWGASMAVAAGTQLVASPSAKRQADENKKWPFDNKYFSWTLVFLSVFWAPTGMLLLLRHPSWETMQAARDFFHMSEWLIVGFGVTNVTQGILGYWVSYKLLERGKSYAAVLNALFGYFGMFFILLYGWDGLGYDRFLYDRDMLPGSPEWTAGVGTAGGVLAAIGDFLTSSVAMTLYIDAVWLIPPFFIIAAPWFQQGARESGVEESDVPSKLRLTLTYLAGVFAVAFVSAAVTALTVRGVAHVLGVGDHVARGLGELPANTSMHVLAYVVGIPLALTALWHGFLKQGRPAHWLLKPLIPAVDTVPAGTEVEQQPVSQ